MPARHPVKAGWRSSVLAVAFLCALWIPLIGMLLGAGTFGAGDENRTLSGPPELGRNGKKWFAVADAFTAYFHDHFGFRGSLITAQALFKVRVLGVSSSPAVVLGKDGWLFYAGDKSIDNHQGVLPFRGDELEHWVRLFNKRENWLARRGIHMLVAIPPDKLSVYPEFLPSSIRKVSEQTRLNVFMAAMRNASHSPVLDLRPVILRAKLERSHLYHPSDTHWTATGAYAGYLAILRDIANTYPDMQPIPFPDPPEPKLRAGDLAKMLGLGRVWRDVPDDPPWPADLTVTETADGELVVQHAGVTDRRLMLFGDSFSAPLIPYLAHHFSQTLVLRTNELKPAAIVARHPDLVLFEMAERTLNNPAPQDPWELMDRMDRQLQQ
jgi:hypothetical protein